MAQLVNYPGLESLSPAKVYEWKKDLSESEERASPSQENLQLQGEWAPVVCHKVAAPEGSEGRVEVTGESRSGQEETLSNTVEQSPVIPELSPEGPDRPHAGKIQSPEVQEQPLVVPGLSNLVPKNVLKNPEDSLVFPEPSHVGPEQSLVGQKKSRTHPEKSLRIPGLSFTNPEQSLVDPKLSPEGPDHPSANPDQSQILKVVPVMPFHPTSPPVHQWTWITSALQPNLSMPKSTLAPQLFHEATSSQPVPTFSLAPQLYANTTSAQPFRAGRTGTHTSAGSVTSQRCES